MRNLQVNGERLWASLMELAQGLPEGCDPAQEFNYLFLPQHHHRRGAYGAERRDQTGGRCDDRQYA